MNLARALKILVNRSTSQGQVYKNGARTQFKLREVEEGSLLAHTLICASIQAFVSSSSVSEQKKTATKTRSQIKGNGGRNEGPIYKI